jgi:hypothetical protein
MKDYRQTELFPAKEELTLSVEDTRVSRFPLPDIKKAKRIKDTSGRSILGSLENSVRITRLERTWADIFDSVWIPYSKTWTAKTTPLGALVLKQRVSVPPTAGKGSSGSPKEQEKLWATPSAMDHLPQRSAEATLRLQEGQRKGRTRPSNLREQVDPETMKMWPTPQAKESGKKLTNYDHKKNRYLTKDGHDYGMGLTQAIQMWPTPTTQEIEHPQAELTATGRRKTKDGTDSHSLNLADTVQQKMLPTPQARDWKGPSGRSLKGLERDLPTVAQEMWPTIVAHEGRLGYQRRDTGKKGTQKSLTTIVVDKEGGRKATKLHLNPTWVEALMGFPPGWTVLGNEESQE